MILDAITSSPLNVIFTIVIGLGLVYLYCRKPPATSSSSSSSSTFSAAHSRFSNTRTYSATVSRTNQVDEELQRAIAQIERQERDMIRQEQDDAYQQSLKADREKQQKRQEEIKRKAEEEKAEKDRKAKEEELHNSLIKLKSEIHNWLPKEPAEGQDGLVKLVFKLPNGSRVKRTFCKSDKMKHLYWYIFSLDSAPLQFKLTTNFPKRELSGRPPIPDDIRQDNVSDSDSDETLEGANLTETQIIFVHDLDA